MKLYKQIIFILIVFLKTETLLSENNLFNVNNIQIEKKDNIENSILVDQAIKKGFNLLVAKILVDADKDKVSDLNLPLIKQLVSYYQLKNILNEENKKEFINFSITFDKDKIHDLFYNRGLSYSEVSDKELYILPLLIKGNEIFIFNNNFFYKNWNKVYDQDFIEFILPQERIEIIKNVNDNKNNLINLELINLFEEYENKNLALVIIEDNKAIKKKIYIKTLIQGKNIFKSLILDKEINNISKFYEKIIIDSKKELINLVKSKNLVDIRTPHFLNTRFNLNKKNNLVQLNLRVKNIDLIEKIYVKEFNKDYMKLRIKYLGKLEKLIIKLNEEKIDLQLVNDLWIIRTL